MKCKCCGAEISTIVTSIFNHDGTDSEYVIPFTESENDAVFFDVDMNWTGYDLSEEEQREDIRCPECGGYPFRSDEIQNYDLCRVVCFGRSKNSDHDDYENTSERADLSGVPNYYSNCSEHIKA